MKSRMWAAIIIVVLILCGVSGYYLMSPGAGAAQAQILRNGEILRTVDLSLDQEFTVTNGDGYNIVTVKDGAIAVTEASCPDHYCQARGFCSGGADIVCLPNRLVIRFLEEAEIDAVSG